jgi:predicted amidohydrolase
LKVQITVVGKTLKDFVTKNEYLDYIKNLLLQTEYPALTVLPEYAWGNYSTEDINQDISEIQRSLLDNQLVVFGTSFRNSTQGNYNSAIVVTKKTINYVDKTRVLDHENSHRGIRNGSNLQAFDFMGLKIAIVICADLWDSDLLNQLINIKHADILLVPSMTVVANGHGNYAKVQWHSLAITRSREYLIPIAVADHHSNGKEYSVGGATCIANPARKSAEMQTSDDFLSLPENGKAIEIIDLNAVNVYREYRIQKGLFSSQKKSSSDN